ncbi:MAG: C-terminal binding protein [Solirubrobacteraceae bacterium]
MELVIVDATYPDDSIERAAAGELGVAVRRALVDAPGAIPAAVGDAEGLLVHVMAIDAAVLEACPALRVLGRYGVGVDSIDVDAATARGIAVVNVPDYGTEEVASHAAALVLTVARRVPEADRLVRAGRWDDWAELRPIAPLADCTLGLVGIGRIGSELVRQIGPLFGSVLAVDPSPATMPDGVERVELEALLGRSDIVSLHLPLTADTRHVIDAAALASMRPHAALVNVSRGGLVDQAALAAALELGRPRFAALDVLDEEPPPATEPLLRSDRVLLTNHIAWYSERAMRRLRHELAERCARVLRGESVASVVNSEGLR